ncbi:hypothetical protein bmyco0003_54500 [Bacillus pseudomycoides]|nr:hypothetical protein bmyco0002_50550 [Bacillus pseudomycoides]EEM07862.1 hypothetical protein bmyco0003_54500 [Bacillus pseudomycoides]
MYKPVFKFKYDTIIERGGIYMNGLQEKTYELLKEKKSQSL